MLNAEAVAKGAQTDLDELGIAKNAREEKLQARKKEQDPKHHAEMERLYRAARAEGSGGAGDFAQSLKAPKKEQTV